MRRRWRRGPEHEQPEGDHHCATHARVGEFRAAVIRVRWARHDMERGMVLTFIDEWYCYPCWSNAVAALGTP